MPKRPHVLVEEYLEQLLSFGLSSLVFTFLDQAEILPEAHAQSLSSQRISFLGHVWRLLVIYGIFGLIFGWKMDQPPEEATNSEVVVLADAKASALDRNYRAALSRALAIHWPESQGVLTDFLDRGTVLEKEKG